MEVILLEKIRNLGNTGEIVNVKDGYGRNFLLKTGKALRADKKNIEFVKRKKDEINKKNVEQKKYAKKIFEKIRGKNLTFKKETKENGDLFASIKPKEISKHFIENLKETIHPSQIDLKKEINKIGKFSLSVNLHPEVVAQLHVLVEKKEAK
jgi:large subunit ribosomal protein L9